MQTENREQEQALQDVKRVICADSELSSYNAI